MVGVNLIVGVSVTVDDGLAVKVGDGEGVFVGGKAKVVVGVKVSVWVGVNVGVEVPAATVKVIVGVPSGVPMVTVGEAVNALRFRLLLQSKPSPRQ